MVAKQRAKNVGQRIARPHPKPKPAPRVPPFAPAAYTFSLDSIEIMDTRSRHEDSNKASVSVAVGSGKAKTVTKNLGNQNNGHFPVNMSVAGVRVDDPNIGIAFHYLVLNSGHKSWEETNAILTKATGLLATQGAKYATSAIGTSLGLAVGTTIMPVIGSALGAAAGWVASNAAQLLTADCDGPVAEEQVVLKGIEVWTRTAHGPYKHVTHHPGLHSAKGCGKNSRYNTYWTISR